MKAFIHALSGRILKHKKLIIIIFLLITLVCIGLQMGVKVNYKMEDYLPADSPSTSALVEMSKEFDTPLYNTKLLVPDINANEVPDTISKLEKIEGIISVQWFETDDYYKDGNALILISIEDGMEVTTIRSIKSIVGEGAALAGQSVNYANAQRMASEEVIKIVAFIVPLIFLILIITTSSFIEPILFLFTIGIAVVINMGTNIIFGEISFITYSISPILQLAVSLDYAIFLLGRFGEYRHETDNVTEAMIKAMKRSVPPIFASALTTIFGFMALLAMRFGLGADLGINLAKGVAISLITVMILLPAVTIVCCKIIDKTKHRSFMPKWNILSKLILKIRIPVLVIVLIMIVPAFLAQYQNKFSYGLGTLDPESESGMDLEIINTTFGRTNEMILLVPRGDFDSELLLTEEIGKLENVKNVTSLAGMAGSQMFIDFLEDEIVKEFYSEDYSRIIIKADTEVESDEAFELIKEIKSTTQKYYDGEVLVTGETAVLYDLKNVVTKDTLLINVLAILAIIIILILTFRSLITPIILVLTIETSIWINLAIPYFTESIICYIGFLVISTVQLGATVDYAILFTDHYNENRKSHNAKESVIITAKETISSILTSGFILSIAGFSIYYISSEDIVSQLGELFGRGALLSMAMVIFFLPAMLVLKERFKRKKDDA